MHGQPKDGDEEGKHHDMRCQGQEGGIIKNAPRVPSCKAQQ